jgi:hypothetical protein
MSYYNHQEMYHSHTQPCFLHECSRATLKGLLLELIVPNYYGKLEAFPSLHWLQQQTSEQPLPIDIG